MSDDTGNLGLRCIVRMGASAGKQGGAVMLITELILLLLKAGIFLTVCGCAAERPLV